MARQLNITGKSSNEVYHILYPNNLIGFCKYDFTLFMEHCTDLCRLSMRTGEYSVEDIVAVRSSISGCHKYVEKNMRGIFEKIVVDCWIEYLCRQNEIGIVTLWSNYMGCSNDFERAVFSRLSEYRHNHAINQWVNLLKQQEYAQRKVEFIFGVKLASPAEANARAAYFDLMYNVALNEAGISLDELGGTELYTLGRTPNSPFVMNTASREIVRNVLGNMFYSENVNVRSTPNSELSDQTAMDAFSLVKNYIPKNDDSLVNTIVKSMIGTPQKVYLPSSFKAVIDLEIDALIESGAVIQRCERCHEYFLKDADYNYDYCNRVTREGVSCLEIARRIKESEKRGENNRKQLDGTAANSAIEERAPFSTNAPHPLRPNEIATFSLRLDKLYKEIAQRVNVDMTQRDFSEWYRQMLSAKRKIATGMLTEKELSEFENYSRTHVYTHEAEQQKPAAEAQKPQQKAPQTAADNGVKPFVFERIDREKAIEQGMLSRNDPALQQSAAPKPAYVPPVQPSVQPFQAAMPSVQPARQAVPAPNPFYGQAPAQPYSPTRIIRGGVTGNVKFNYYDKPLENTVPAPQPPQQNTQDNSQDSGFMPFAPDNESRVTSEAERPAPREKAPERIQPRFPNPLAAAIDDLEDDIFDTGDLEAEIDSLGNDLDFSAPASLDEVEEDVKIYNLAQPEPAPRKPIENVKIFEPSRKKKNRLTDGLARKPMDRLLRPLEAPAYSEPQSFDELDEEDDSDEIVESIQPEIIQRPPESPLKAKAVSAYRTLVEPRDEETPPQPANDFSEVLRGINRSDGFEESTETDADGMPLSHKTKHVMDAIFKPSKASPFLSIRLDDDDEDK